MMGAFRELIEQRRVEPADDVMTTLVEAEIDGEPLSEMDILSYAILLILAGNETTRNATSGGLLALLEHPGQLERLRGEPALLDSAIEEILRWTSPVIHFARTVTRDVEVGGVPMRAGETLALWYPSANRDEDVFEQPEVFDIGREPNEHLAFGGYGEHFCLGATLARLELRGIFGHLLERLEEIRVDGDVERLGSGLIGGIKRLPISYGVRGG